MRSTMISILAFGALAMTGSIDDAVMAEKRQISVNLSTGGSTSSLPDSSSQTTAASNPSTTAASPSSQSSVVQTSSTVTVVPTSTSISVTSVTSTLTPSNSGSTGSPTVVTTASSATYSISYSSYVTSSASDVISVYTTVSNGAQVTATRTSRTLVPVTTSSPVSTQLASSEDNNGSGLSESSKKIIGGVVGGVGGALLIGALAFTAWRIWGKKKNLHDDDLYDPNQPQEKMSGSTDHTPFRSTLDQYHQPGPVNTASNF